MTDLDSTNPRDERWALIINPTAGTRRLHNEWTAIRSDLKRAELDYTQFRTEYPGHAISLARHLVEQGFRNIIVVGGDGTLNEVVNGIYSSSIDDKSSVTLALYPYGTGNDWGRYWGMRRGGRNIADILYRRHRVEIDLGTFSYEKAGRQMTHYFINSIGFGIDAEVVYFTNRLKQIFGGHSWLYTAALLAAVFVHRSHRMTVTADTGDSYTGPVFTANLGNGCYSGGGLKQTDGCPTDGLMFATIIKNVDIIKILRGLGLLFAGRLWEIEIARVFRERSLHLTTDRNLLFETDGVLIDLRTQGSAHPITEYDFSIIPGALQMIVP